MHKACLSTARWSNAQVCQISQGQWEQERITRDEGRRTAKVLRHCFALFNSDLCCMKQILDKLEWSKGSFQHHTTPEGCFTCGQVTAFLVNLNLFFFFFLSSLHNNHFSYLWALYLRTDPGGCQAARWSECCFPPFPQVEGVPEEVGLERLWYRH